MLEDGIKIKLSVLVRLAHRFAYEWDEVFEEVLQMNERVPFLLSIALATV